jgi:hypothetical protein
MKELFLFLRNGNILRGRGISEVGELLPWAGQLKLAEFLRQLNRFADYSLLLVIISHLWANDESGQKVSISIVDHTSTYPLRGKSLRKGCPSKP